jgi:hypothetical protein
LIFYRNQPGKKQPSHVRDLGQMTVKKLFNRWCYVLKKKRKIASYNVTPLKDGELKIYQWVYAEIN